MFLLDFDSTLYQSHGLSNEIQKILYSYGVSREDFESSVHLAVHGKTGDYFDYSFENHLDLLWQMGYRFEKEKVLMELDNIFVKNFIFEDTIFFLEEVKKMGQPLILLTAGNEDFQRKKITSAEIEKYFDRIAIVNGKKDEFITNEMKKSAQTFFINDNLKENIKVKEVHPDLIVVTKHNARKNTPEEWEKSGIVHFETLTEILNYIEQYGQE